MKMTGKILFFNEKEGKGILITSQKQKLEFGVVDWDDFDVMPSLGLEVSFDVQDNKPINIISKESELQQASQESLEDGAQAQENSADNNYEEKSLENATSAEDEVIPSDVVIFPDDEDVNSDLVVYDTADSQEDKDSYEAEESTQDDNLSVDKEADAPDTAKENTNQTGSLENCADEIENEELPPDVVVFPDEAEPEEEHFEADNAVAMIEEMAEEEPEPREESITLSLNLATAVGNYFDIIKKHINRRQSYKKVEGRLDYLVTRRFIWTTFNNLSEIDLHIITPKIKMLSDDLKVMSKVYDDFSTKTKHPQLAFAEVFLSCQAEYKKIREGAEKIIEKINLLKSNEKIIGGALRVKKEELDKNIKSQEFDAMKNEFKSLNGAYVDVVHMMAELDERYKHDLELLNSFEEEYRNDFYEIFEAESLKYKSDILEILNAQAFIVDAQLWQQAKVSKSVKAHFKKSAITGELNTKTYLKYYLDTLDSSRATGDTKKLFELYEKLTTQQKDYILVLVSSAQDAMEYESCIKSADKSFDVKSFIDEKAAIKWAMKNSVKVLVVEDVLQKTSVENFLNVYHNKILVRPKIVLIGNKPKSNSSEYMISKLLLKNASPRVVSDSVKSMLETK